MKGERLHPHLRGPGVFGAALGDRFGRRGLFVTGLAIFTAASAPAAFTFPYCARHR
jgi:MFS family permease